MGLTQSTLLAPSSLNVELTMSYILSARPHTQIQLWLNGEQYSADSDDLKNYFILHPSAEIQSIIPQLKLNNPILQKTIQISLPEHYLDQLLMSDEGCIFIKTLPSDQLLSSRSQRSQLSSRIINNSNNNRAGVLNEITSSQNLKYNNIFNKQFQAPMMSEKCHENDSIHMNDSQISMFSMKSPKQQLSSHNQYNSALNYTNSNNTHLSRIIPSSQSSIITNNQSSADLLESSNMIHSQRNTQLTNAFLKNKPSQLTGTPIQTRQSISIQEKLKTLGTIPSYTYVTMDPNSENSYNSLQFTKKITTPKTTNQFLNSKESPPQRTAISLPKKEAFTFTQKDLIQSEAYLNNRTKPLNLNVSALQQLNQSNNFVKVRSHSTISSPLTNYLPPAMNTNYLQISQNLPMDQPVQSDYSTTQKSLCRNKSCCISPLSQQSQIPYYNQQYASNSQKQSQQINEESSLSPLSSGRYYLPQNMKNKEAFTHENQSQTNSMFFKAVQDAQTASVIRRR